MIDYPSNGLQNGSPDGIALVDAGNVLVEFLSYEGTFTGVGGPAAGMTSIDVGVSEDGSGRRRGTACPSGSIRRPAITSGRGRRRAARACSTRRSSHRWSSAT